MQLLQPRRHPQALAVDLCHRAPVHRRRAGPQRLVHAVAEPHPLHERQAVRQLQADLHARDAVLGGRVGGGGAADWDSRTRSRRRSCTPQRSRRRISSRHHLFELLDVFRPGGLGIRRRLQDRVLRALAQAVQDGRLPVGPEDAAQELAHHRDRAPLVQHERRQRRRLVNAPADADAGQRDDASVSRAGSTMVHLRSSYRVAAGRLPVSNSMSFRTISRSTAWPTFIRPCPATLIDPSPSRWPSRRANARVRRRSCGVSIVNVHSPAVEHVAGLVGAGLIQRRFQADHHPVLARYQLVRAHPAPVRAQDLVVRRADQGAAVLQDERDAVAHALGHGLGLHRHAELTVRGGAEQHGAAGARHLLDAARGAVGQQHRRPRGDARRTSVPDQDESAAAPAAASGRPRPGTPSPPSSRAPGWS